MKKIKNMLAISAIVLCSAANTIFGYGTSYCQRYDAQDKFQRVQTELRTAQNNLNDYYQATNACKNGIMSSLLSFIVFGKCWNACLCGASSFLLSYLAESYNSPKKNSKSSTFSPFKIAFNTMGISSLVLKVFGLTSTSRLWISSVLGIGSWYAYQYFQEKTKDRKYNRKCDDWYDAEIIKEFFSIPGKCPYSLSAGILLSDVMMQTMSFKNYSYLYGAIAAIPTIFDQFIKLIDFDKYVFSTLKIMPIIGLQILLMNSSNIKHSV